VRILSAADVDLIDPFPIAEIPHLYNWMRAYKNIVESDLSPKDLPSFEAYFKEILPNCITYGVIDRENTLGFRHEAPIIGMVMFEPNSPWNKYIHIASNRRAWGSGFMDQAITLAVADLFTLDPSLLRVSAFVLANNSPVRALAKRLGWQFEGVMKDMVAQGEVGKSVVHYGLTRAVWQEHSQRANEAGEQLVKVVSQ
jgi:RimJ/RimL family protein N-acetyltransferase